MALGALPYKAVWVSGANDANLVPIATVNITDALGVVKAANVKVPYDGSSSFTDALTRAIEAQMVADSSKVAAAQAVIAGLRVGG